MNVTLIKLLIVILMTAAWTSVQADDLKIADDFKSGDLVSADTFNQIFDTIEKINRTVKDSDLVGVWSCNAMTTRSTTMTGRCTRILNWIDSLGEKFPSIEIFS